MFVLLCFGYEPFPNKIMLIGYGRVSTTDQDPQMQVAALKAAGCDKVFAETASGAQRDRPQLMAALDYMRPGDTLVVWKLDRLARSVRQLIDTAELLKSRSMGLKSLTETIDTNSAGGEFIFTVFAALAQFERSLISERTREGLAHAQAQGRKLGRKSKLTTEKARQIEAMLRDTYGYPFISDVIKASGLGRTAFYNHYPPEAIQKFRPKEKETAQ